MIWVFWGTGVLGGYRKTWMQDGILSWREQTYRASSTLSRDRKGTSGIICNVLACQEAPKPMWRASHPSTIAPLTCLSRPGFLSYHSVTAESMRAKKFGLCEVQKVWKPPSFRVCFCSGEVLCLGAMFLSEVCHFSFCSWKLRCIGIFWKRGHGK